ncbi:AEC family transporter [Uliginosibacterium sp. sgz301328]|uniref:AEC family transporter n=1 Tax=Uliginosibacterium sp. sgz301328 TaxID=3243764 RepID=UPI00359DEADD
MLERIISILFPMFAIAAVGYFVARHHRPDLSHANRLTMDVFAPALSFAVLAGKDFDLAAHRTLALAMLVVVALSGIAGLAVARAARVDLKTLLPPLMFGNSGNLGIPLAVLAFGDAALPSAVVLFVISTSLHFVFGGWLLDRQARLLMIWRLPLVFATIAGAIVSLMGWVVWPPLLMAIKMLGDIAIPLMLFALGARLAEAELSSWRIGLTGAIARPLLGAAVSWLVGIVLGIRGLDFALLVIYGAMPPAVLNYIFAERFNQEPDKVASIVLIGNILSLVFLPIALAMTLD